LFHVFIYNTLSIPMVPHTQETKLQVNDLDPLVLGNGYSTAHPLPQKKSKTRQHFMECIQIMYHTHTHTRTSNLFHIHSFIYVVSLPPPRRTMFSDTRTTIHLSFPPFAPRPCLSPLLSTHSSSQTTIPSPPHHPSPQICPIEPIHWPPPEP